MSFLVECCAMIPIKLHILACVHAFGTHLRVLRSRKAFLFFLLPAQLLGQSVAPPTTQSLSSPPLVSICRCYQPHEEVAGGTSCKQSTNLLLKGSWETVPVPDYNTSCRVNSVCYSWLFWIVLQANLDLLHACSPPDQPSIKGLLGLSAGGSSIWLPVSVWFVQINTHVSCTSAHQLQLSDFCSPRFCSQPWVLRIKLVFTRNLDLCLCLLGSKTTRNLTTTLSQLWTEVLSCLLTLSHLGYILLLIPVKSCQNVAEHVDFITVTGRCWWTSQTLKKQPSFWNVPILRVVSLLWQLWHCLI